MRVTGSDVDLEMSSYTKLDRAIRIRGFAIKYVLRGVERYTVDGWAHAVSEGQSLLANEACDSHVLIDDTEPVLGLCIDLAPALLEEVVQARGLPEAFAEQGHARVDARFLTGPEFPDGVHDASCTTLGPLLHALASRLFADPTGGRSLDEGLFYALAEGVVRDHALVLPRLRSIKAVRAGTRKDIYRRVQRAKARMDAHLDQPLAVEAMAHEAAMSPYHFFRAFRAVEGLSPHQYRLMRRLEVARAVLLAGHASVQEVAALTGFADAASFSKAFRKRHGQAPSALLRRLR